MIRDSYCKTHAFIDKSLLVSNLKGIEIRLTPSILAEILQLQYKGPTILCKKWYSALNITDDEVYQELYIIGSTNFIFINLKPFPKIFNNICQHSSLPHCGSLEYVSNNDDLVIYHLFQYQKLNLPHLIIQNMIATTNKDYKRNTVPYGMVISKNILYFNVPLLLERFSIKISKFSSKNISHMKQVPSIPPSPKVTFSPTTIKYKRSARQSAIQPNDENQFHQEHSSPKLNIIPSFVIPSNINPLHDKTTTKVPTAHYLNNPALQSHPCTMLYHQHRSLT